MKSIIIMSVVLVSGCSFFVKESHFGESWTGKKADSLISLWGKPVEKKVIEGGGEELIYKLFNNSCTYYFYTNSNGVISDYKYKSTTLGTCKPIG